MKISKLTHLIFVLLAFVSIAVGTEITELNTPEMGGKLFCVQPGKTYCLNVVNYPRDRLNELFEGLMVDNSDA